VAQVDLRRVVGDEINLFFPQERLEVRLRDVGSNEAGLRRHFLAGPRREVVHDDDAVPVVQMPLRHVRADEAGTTGHEDVHNSRSA
jgi:hypothetical protein